MQRHHFMRKKNILIRRWLLVFSFFFFTIHSYSANANLEENFVQAFKAQWEQTEQSVVFLDFFKAKKWKEAFYHWDASFANSSFNTSPTGRALYAYLLFKNKIRIMGIELLFQIDYPEEILEELKSLWKVAVPYTYKIWSFVDIKWSAEWSNIFDPKTELVVLLSKTFSVEDLESIDLQFKNYATQMPGWLRWRVIIALAARQRFNGATVRLKSLLTWKNPPVTPALIYLTLGRLSFQQKAYDEAISYYEKIPRKSDYWLIAHEEIGWTYLLKNQPNRTLGYTQTLMHPVLMNQVGPEPSYLHALASIQVCDYLEAIRTLRNFKVRFTSKIKALRELLTTGRTPATKHLRKQFFNLKKTPLDMLDIGWQFKDLPFLVYRDEFLFDFLKIERRLFAEEKRSRNLLDEINTLLKSKNAPESSVNMDEDTYSQNFLKNLAEKIIEKRRSYNRRFYQRLVQLAKKDLKELDEVVKKLQIIEAEILQFVTLKLPTKEAEKAYFKRKKKRKSMAIDYRKAQKPYNLVFEDRTRELWFDELGYYRVQVDQCIE